MSNCYNGYMVNNNNMNSFLCLDMVLGGVEGGGEAGLGRVQPGEQGLSHLVPADLASHQLLVEYVS